MSGQLETTDNGDDTSLSLKKADNMVINEEFKIWKKSVPMLYQHITTYKPGFLKKFTKESIIPKKFIFQPDKTIKDEKFTDTIIDTPLYYSYGSEVYQLDCKLPKGLMSNDNLNSDNDIEADQLLFGSGDINNVHESDQNRSIFSYQGEDIIKLQTYKTIGGKNTNNNGKLLVMSTSGSLAWFDRNVSKYPYKVITEYVGPSTSYSVIHDNHISSGKRTTGKPPLYIQSGIASDNMFCDFAVSESGETIVKTHGANGSIIKIVDNYSRPGQVLNTLKLGDSTNYVHTVRFMDNNIFACCSTDNTIKFYDCRALDSDIDRKPIWDIHTSTVENETLLSFDISPHVETFLLTGSSAGNIKLWDLRSCLASDDTIIKGTKELGLLYHENADPVIDIQFSPHLATEFLSVGSQSGFIYHWDINPIMQIWEEKRAKLEKREKLKEERKKMKKARDRVRQENGEDVNIEDDDDDDDNENDIDVMGSTNEGKDQKNKAQTTSSSSTKEHDEDFDYSMSSEEYDVLVSSCIKFLHTSGGRRKKRCCYKNQVYWHPDIDGVIGCIDSDGTFELYKGYYGKDKDLH
ncbi:uncharacterized protein SCODWIG_03000 [Saccharomycodes ludwigii]|uniref:Uncharacterized protein n=1 Tax=Saccharomycodes ludwigii TaxID=36035 RepID=A0A376B9J8_9ASCO|nr:hypothetical protein SCDLUD_002132 [Saccharomycodes ludwigii]KAH3902312.1 hypothetical protein SCDLUD_002132 [Saccharomycodes ludwigii]SSD61239.1 uncharacterized protein SCODWIG_03000 [Saccharomycodes ludwigii]